MAAELKILVTAQNQAKGVLGDLHSDLEKTSSLGDKLGGALKVGLAAGAVAATSAIAGLGAVLATSVQAASEAEDVAAQLEAVIKSTGGVAGMTADEVNNLALELSKVTKFEDDAIVKSSALLLTFTKVGEDVFPQAQEAILNVAQAMGTDLQSATIMVGKALNDPIKGMTAMSRAGIQFTEDQKEMVKRMIESGDQAGAQAIILKELETQFGGAAKAAGNTLSGQLEILKNQLGNVKEEIGAALIPALTDLAKSWGPKLIEGAKKVAKFFTGTLIPGIKYLLAVVEDGDVLNDWLTHLPKPIQKLTQFIGRLVAGVRDAILFIGGFAKAIADVAQGFEGWDIIDKLNLPDGLHRFADGVLDVIDAFRRTDGDFIDKVKAAFGAAWDAIHLWWDEKGAAWVDTTVGKIKAWLETVPGKVRELVTNAADWLADTWNSIHEWWDTKGAQWAKDTGAKIQAWLNEAVKTVKAEIEQLVVTIKSVDWAAVQAEVQKVGQQVRDQIVTWFDDPAEQERIGKALGTGIRAIIGIAIKAALEGTTQPGPELSSAFADQFSENLKRGITPAPLQRVITAMMDEATQGAVEKWGKENKLLAALKAAFDWIQNPSSEPGSRGGRGSGLQSLAEDSGSAFDTLKEKLTDVRDFIRDNLKTLFETLSGTTLPDVLTAVTDLRNFWVNSFYVALGETWSFISGALLPTLGNLDVMLRDTLVSAAATGQAALDGLLSMLVGVEGQANNTTGAINALIDAINSIPSVPGGGASSGSAIAGNGRALVAAGAGGGGRSVSIVITGNSFGGKSDVDYMLTQLDRKLRLQGGILPL